MSLPAAKQSAIDETLLSLTMPACGVWGREARDCALARVTAQGLPSQRDEYWRYTNPQALVTPNPAKAALFHDDETPLFSDMDCLKIVFVDGLFDADKSDCFDLENIEIQRLSETMSADIHWAKDVYGVLEAKGQDPVPRPLAALNTAYASDGVCIRVTGQVSKPVNIVYVHNSETSDVIMHHVIRVEPGAQATILENGSAAARFNKCIEIDVADRGVLHHVQAQGRNHQRKAVTHIFAHLGTQSTFKSFTMTVNGVLTRNEAIVDFTGDDATAHIAGASLGDGDFHHDDTVFVTHGAQNCESRQVFKKVLRNGATGVFQGKILVKQVAQKTDGYQISQSLLLDDDSQFLAKPELEIYADDVVCSHGSTSGAIDETGLFYLRSRGIPEGVATDLMVIAFLAEAIEEIEDSEIAEDITARLKSWLERRRSAPCP